MKFSVCGTEETREQGICRNSFLLKSFYICFCFREEASEQAF